MNTGFFKNAGFPTAYKVFENYLHLKPEDISDAVMFILGTKPNVQVRRRKKQFFFIISFFHFCYY